jgi:hypothetical protein
MNPMFLAYSPPQMLPTITMNPTDAPAPAATGKVKRSEEEMAVPFNRGAMHIKRDPSERPFYHRIDLDMLWWLGAGMTIFGGAAYLL